MRTTNLVALRSTELVKNLDIRRCGLSENHRHTRSTLMIFRKEAQGEQDPE